MTGKHRIIVSAENSAYMAWQCKLFYFSCVARQGHQPIFIVHANGDAWDPGFLDLVRAGAAVRPAPSYLCEKRLTTRNTVGTLLHAAQWVRPDEFIVLCDPDMIFARKTEFPSRLAGNFYSYLHYDQEHIAHAASQFGLTHRALLKREDQIRCGVPYVIPAAHAARLGEVWLDAMDCFSIAGRGWDSVWLDVMFAFGLAVAKLGWTVATFDAVDMNDQCESPLRHPILHYCLGDDAWDKRWFRSDEKVHDVWDSTFQATEGSVAQELFGQMEEARRFYRESFLNLPLGHLRTSA